MSISTGHSQVPTNVPVSPPTLKCGANSIKGLKASGAGSAYKPGDALLIAEAGALRNAVTQLQDLTCPAGCKWKVAVDLRNEVWSTPTWINSSEPFHSVIVNMTFDGTVDCSTNIP